jgi:hypothetical protein
MTISGTDIVEQLRGRMKFFHVGDPVRRDMKRACDAINELRGVQLRETHTAASVGDWLEERGIKLLPWQRKRLGLDPVEKEQDLTPHPRLGTPVE